MTSNNSINRKIFKELKIYDMYAHRSTIKKLKINELSKHTILIVPYKWSKGYIRSDSVMNDYITEMLKNAPQTKILQIDDMHSWTFDYAVLKEWCNQVKIGYIMCRYVLNDEFERLSKYMFPLKCIETPWFITEVQYDYSNNVLLNDFTGSKEYDILFYGVHFGTTYPLRSKLFNLLRDNKELNERFKIKIIDNTDSTTSRIPLKEISELINKSWITVATPSKFNYMVRKYIEIPASNSVLMGSIPKQAQKLYSDNYIKITYGMTDDEIIKKISTSLENKQKLTEIIMAMRNKIASEHNMYNVYSNIRKAIK